MKFAALLLLMIPAVAFAEVSDKMPTILEIILKGIGVSACVFFAAWFRWWLGFLMAPIFILFVAGAVSLWDEVHMREALLHEQGWVYFGALGFQAFIIGGATVMGAFLGYKRRMPNQKKGIMT